METMPVSLSVCLYLVSTTKPLNAREIVFNKSCRDPFQLTLCGEIKAVCSEIHTKHVNKLCGQNVELLDVKLAVHIVTTVRYIQ